MPRRPEPEMSSNFSDRSHDGRSQTAGAGAILENRVDAALSGSAVILEPAANCLPRRRPMLSYSKSAICLLLASPLIAAVVAVGCSDGTVGGGATASTQSGSGASGGAGGAGGAGTAGGVTTSAGGADGGGAWGADGGLVVTQCTNSHALG
jgi:hypothetical protein